jgi:hypothetical protein
MYNWENRSVKMMKIDERPTIKSPVVGPVHDEIVRVCGECLHAEAAQMGTRAYARTLAVWRALQQAPQGKGVDLADIYRQLSIIADGVDGAPDAVAEGARRVSDLGMPDFSSFYTEYVSKSLNKCVRAACRGLGLGLIAVVSPAEHGDRRYLYLKWENKATHARSVPRNRSSESTRIESAESSVFIAGPAIVHPRQFFGRERELGRLFGLLKGRPMQCAAIVGPARIGKSSLLRCLEKITTTEPRQLRTGQRADWLPEPKRYRWVYLDFLDPRLKRPEGVFRALLGGFGIAVPEALDQDRFLEEMSCSLDQPTIVLMDHIDKALGREPVDEKDEILSLEFWEGLRSLASARGNLAYIMASREKAEQLARRFQVFASPFFNIFGHIIELGPLNDREARDMIRSAPVGFPDQDVDWIVEASKGLPSRLGILCRERLIALQSADGSLDWQEEGLKQVECFSQNSPIAT